VMTTQSRKASISVAASPLRKRLLDTDISVKCPLCNKAFPKDVIADHAADCCGQHNAGASSSMGAEPSIKRQRCQDQRPTVFAIGMELTRKLASHSSDEPDNELERLPVGKHRCPMCFRLFVACKLEAHAATCDGTKRLKLADKVMKAGGPIQGIVNYDSATTFLSRLRKDIQALGLPAAQPRLMYHWTAEVNHIKIEDTNFYVPKQRQVANGNVYGNGVYAAVGFATSRGYAKDVTKGILCLTSPGKVYDNNAQGFAWTQQRGYDSACFWKKTGYVFFSADQVLPCFLVSNDDYQRAEKRIEDALPELLQALSSILGAEHDSDNQVGVQMATTSVLQSWLGRLRKLIGM